MPETIVIVGASLTGGTAAATLREEGFDGNVILIGAEEKTPYERPPLSKEYLRSESPFERQLVRPADFWQKNNVETRFGETVAHIDPTARAVVLADGEAIHYDKVLIATGGRNRKPPIPGLDLNGIYALRTVEDCDRIKEMAQPGRKAVVVGMGFIGSEVTASLRTHGLEVTALDGGKAPLARVLGEEIGNVLAQLHRDNGVDVRLEQAVAGFEGEGSFKGVRTGSGDLIEGDFCVVGLGIEPVTDLVAGSDINVDNGIVVDAYCRTNVEDVYAAGDVANHYHPVFGRQMRVEHYNNALKHGAAAALSMLGRGAPYSEIHSFWSDQYDVTLEYAGHHMSWDELVMRGDLASRDFIAFYLKDGLIEAAAGMNRALDVRAAVPLIRARKPIDVAKLRDPAVGLAELR